MKSEGWVTIKGVHVYIGASGKIEKGPAKFIGSTRDDLTGGGKNTTKNSSSKNSSSRRKIPETMAQYDGGVKTPASRGRGSFSKNRAKPKEEKKYPNGIKTDMQKEFYDKNLASGMSEDLARETAILDSHDEFGTIHRSDEKIKKPSEKTSQEYESMGQYYRRTDTTAIKKTRGDFTRKNSYSPTTGEKYPSSVKTPAEKRAYTRARNDGLSSSEATKVATGKTKPLSTNSRNAADSIMATGASSSKGVVNLYTGKSIQAGSVYKAGVNKNREVIYKAKDANGKTITLDSGDLGALFVAGADKLFYTK